MDNSKAENTSVPLIPEARRYVEALRDRTGIPKTEALKRILEWFTTLDPKFQQAVLLRDEDTKREFARLVLLDMAGMSKDDLPMAAEDLSPDDAAKVAQAMVQRLLIAYRAEVAAGKMERRKGKA